MPPVVILITELNCEFCQHSLFYGAMDFEKMASDHNVWENDGCPKCGNNTQYGDGRKPVMG